MKRLLSSLPAIIFLLSGCATRALWENNNYCEATSQPNLQLSLVPSRGDVLVEYDEISERTERVRRRAYFLEANARRLDRQGRPKFVNPSKYGDARVIPMLTPGSIVPAQELRAGWGTNHFVLYSGTNELSSHSLPAYVDPATRRKQIILTPPALILDITLLSTFYGLLAWAETGFSPHIDY